MQTPNVYYSERPERVIVRANGDRAVIELPVNVTEVETEDGTQYLAEKVYSVETRNRDGLAATVEAHYDAWLERAKEVEPQVASLSDVIDALNALTDIILGGMM